MSENAHRLGNAVTKLRRSQSGPELCVFYPIIGICQSGEHLRWVMFRREPKAQECRPWTGGNPRAAGACVIRRWSTVDGVLQPSDEGERQATLGPVRTSVRISGSVRASPAREVLLHASPLRRKAAGCTCRPLTENRGRSRRRLRPSARRHGNCSVQGRQFQRHGSHLFVVPGTWAQKRRPQVGERLRAAW